MIPDHLKVSDAKIQSIGIKFSFTTQNNKLIIQANSKDNQTYVGQLQANAYVNFQLVRQSLSEGEYKVLQITDEKLKIKIGWNVLQMTSKTKSEIKQLKEIIQKSIDKQQQMQRIIECQQRKIFSHQRKMNEYQIQILDLRKLTQQHQCEINEMKKMIKYLSQRKVQPMENIKPRRQEEKIQPTIDETAFKFYEHPPFMPRKYRKTNEDIQQPNIQTEKNEILESIKQKINLTFVPFQDIIELDLSDIKIKRFTSEMKQTIQKCRNLEILSLTGCQLYSLDNLPRVNLTAIDLTDNKINSLQLINLICYGNLGQLIMPQNNVLSVELLYNLKSLKNLKEIDFSNNPICRAEGYCERIFNIFPNLETLDNKDRYGNDKQEDNGHYFSKMLSAMRQYSKINYIEHSVKDQDQDQNQDQSQSQGQGLGGLGYGFGFGLDYDQE